MKRLIEECTWCTMDARRTRWAVALVTAIIACLGPEPATAWEFSMDGVLIWRIRAVSQLGPRGFFGKYDLDNSSTMGDYASANAWAGAKLNDLSSSSGVSEQNMETKIRPELKINEAMRLRGNYRIAAFGNPLASAYVNSTSPGAQVAFSEGQWTMWWVSAQTPWGIVVVGKRPFEFGCGLQYNGAEDLTSESLLFAAPVGPFRFGLGLYPWRRRPDSPFRQDQPNNALPKPPDNPYFNPGDFNALLAMSPVAFFTCDAGPVSFGIMAEYFSYRMGPESQRLQVDRSAFVPTDVASTDGSVFLKYFNGRCFFNAEVDWVNRITRYQRSLNGTFFGTPDRTDGTGSLFAPRYIESWRWMVETGLVMGPVKATIFYAWLPGPDRRHGVLIDRQPYFYGFGNYGLFSPYSTVMSFYYGAGLGLLNLNTDGYTNDASLLALRLDCAVAANLNTHVSICMADRQSAQGYGWGFIRPAATGSRVEFLNLSTINAANADVPSIPENSLGWEVDAGFDWQLLDGWVMRCVAGYWQPGKWFNYACIDKRVPNWDNPAAGNRFGINPDRVIDPVLAMRIQVLFEL